MANPIHHCLGFLLAIGFVFATAGRAQNVNITVNAAQTVRSVDARTFGVNAVMWDPMSANGQTIALALAAGWGVIRMPGGSLSDVYDWTTNKSYSITTSGAYSIRGSLNTWSWSAGFDQFMKLVGGLNSASFVTVNYGSGSPRQAAAWVAYANASSALLGTASDVALGVDAYGVDWKTAGFWSNLRASAPLATDDGRNFLRLNRSAPFALKYWEIGNEIYGTWETDCSTVPNDAFAYATAVGTANTGFWALMKAVDPTIKVGVVIPNGEDAYANSNGSTHAHTAVNPRTKATHYGWGPVMLSTLQTLGVTPDFLTYHRYEQNPGQENDTLLLAAPESGVPGTTSSWAADAQSLRQELNDYMGSNGAAVELLVGENNSANSNPGKQADSLVNGLYYADTVGNILQTEFNSHVWWALRNGPATTTNSAGLSVLSGNMSSSLYGWRINGDFGVLGTPSSAVTSPPETYFDPFPVYYMMKLMTHFASGGDTVVTATSNNALLPAYAVLRTADGSLRLLVINKSPSSTLTANINLTGFVPQAAVSTYSYGIPQDSSARTGAGSPDIATSSLGIGNTSFTASFAAYSATVLALQAIAPPTITAQPSSQRLAVGATVAFTVLASGSPADTYQWNLSGTPISGATNPQLLITGATAANAGGYTCLVSNSVGSTLSNTAVLTVTSTADPGRLTNLSVNTAIGSRGILTLGFVTGGSGTSGTQPLLIGSYGPTIAPLLPLGTLAMPDPELKVFNGANGTQTAANAGWASTPANKAAVAAAVAATFATPLTDPSSKDSATVVPLSPNGVGYTVQIDSVSGTAGTAVTELYDDTPSGAYTSTTPRLINLSCNFQVVSGGILTEGFTVGGSTARTVLIRASGPAIAAFLPPGITAMPDPQLKVFNAAESVIASNAGWGGNPQIATVAQSVYAAPYNASSADSAILLTLPPGSYTVQASSVSGTAGTIVVEVFEVP